MLIALHTTSFNMCSYYLTYRWGNRGPEELSNLPEVTQLGSRGKLVFKFSSIWLLYIPILPGNGN